MHLREIHCRISVDGRLFDAQRTSDNSRDDLCIVNGFVGPLLQTAIKGMGRSCLTHKGVEPRDPPRISSQMFNLEGLASTSGLRNHVY